MTTTRYRKKPVEIEAMQLTDNWGDVCDWINSHTERVDPLRPTAYMPSGPDLDICIVTLEGDMRAVPGDWIIRGVAGEFYPCKPEIFDATYSLAGSSNGAERIAVERARQVSDEGYSPEGDAGKVFELTEAAICYAGHGAALEEYGVDLVEEELPTKWPWAPEFWKPTTGLRDLVKAGALIAAAIDSLLADEGEVR